MMMDDSSSVVTDTTQEQNDEISLSLFQVEGGGAEKRGGARNEECSYSTLRHVFDSTFHDSSTTTNENSNSNLPKVVGGDDHQTSSSTRGAGHQRSSKDDRRRKLVQRQRYFTSLRHLLDGTDFFNQQKQEEEKEAQEDLAALCDLIASGDPFLKFDEQDEPKGAARRFSFEEDGASGELSIDVRELEATKQEKDARNRRRRQLVRQLSRKLSTNRGFQQAMRRQSRTKSHSNSTEDDPFSVMEDLFEDNDDEFFAAAAANYPKSRVARRVAVEAAELATLRDFLRCTGAVATEPDRMAYPTELEEPGKAAEEASQTLFSFDEGSAAAEKSIDLLAITSSEDAVVAPSPRHQNNPRARRRLSRNISIKDIISGRRAFSEAAMAVAAFNQSKGSLGFDCEEKVYREAPGFKSFRGAPDLQFNPFDAIDENGTEAGRSVDILSATAEEEEERSVSKSVTESDDTKTNRDLPLPTLLRSESLPSRALDSPDLGDFCDLKPLPSLLKRHVSTGTATETMSSSSPTTDSTCSYNKSFREDLHFNPFEAITEHSEGGSIHPSDIAEVAETPVPEAKAAPPPLLVQLSHQMLENMLHESFHGPSMALVDSSHNNAATTTKSNSSKAGLDALVEVKVEKQPTGRTNEPEAAEKARQEMATSPALTAAAPRSDGVAPGASRKPPLSSSPPVTRRPINVKNRLVRQDSRATVTNELMQFFESQQGDDSGGGGGGGKPTDIRQRNRASGRMRSSHRRQKSPSKHPQASTTAPPPSSGRSSRSSSPNKKGSSDKKPRRRSTSSSQDELPKQTTQQKRLDRSTSSGAAASNHSRPSSGGGGGGSRKSGSRRSDGVAERNSNLRSKISVKRASASTSDLDVNVVPRRSPSPGVRHRRRSNERSSSGSSSRNSSPSKASSSKNSSNRHSVRGGRTSSPSKSSSANKGSRSPSSRDRQRTGGAPERSPTSRGERQSAAMVYEALHEDTSVVEGMEATMAPPPLTASLSKSRHPRAGAGSSSRSSSPSGHENNLGSSHRGESTRALLEAVDAAGDALLQSSPSKSRHRSKTVRSSSPGKKSSRPPQSSKSTENVLLSSSKDEPTSTKTNGGNHPSHSKSAPEMGGLLIDSPRRRKKMTAV